MKPRMFHYEVQDGIQKVCWKSIAWKQQNDLQSHQLCVKAVWR
jgi:hypothetical protein